MKMIKYILSVFLVAILFTSCEVDRTQPVFEDSPTQRINNAINELSALLLSEPQGYSGIYFPNDEVVGGVNFHMNFSEDLRVKMTSDFKETTALTDTRYDIITGTTAAELVFTSGSRHITDLIQDGAQGFNTFFGSNSFQYLGEENGMLMFQDIRSNGKLILSPSGFSDFDTESVASADITYANRLSFTDVDCSNASVYDNLVMDIAGAPEGDIRYILNYSTDNFFFDGETTDAQGVSTRQGFGVAFTLINGEEAIKISPALELGSTIIENFIFDPVSSEYVATEGGITARIAQTSLSAPSGEDIFDLPGSVYFYDTADGTNPLMSPCFQEEVIDQINTNLDNLFGPGVFSFAFYAVFLNLEPGNCTNLAIWIQNTNGDTFRANYCNFASIQDNTLFLPYQGPFGGPNDAFLEDTLRPLIDFFGSSQGLLYTNEGSFRASINSFSNASGAFTSLENPALRSYGLFF